MKIIKTFEEAEFSNPHAINARLLHVGEHPQFEHLMMEPDQLQNCIPHPPLFTCTSWKEKERWMQVMSASISVQTC